MVEFSERHKQAGLDELTNNKDLIDLFKDYEDIAKSYNERQYSQDWYNKASLIDDKMSVKHKEIIELKSFVFAAYSLANSLSGNESSTQYNDYQRLVKLLELDMFGILAKALIKVGKISDFKEIIYRIY